MSRHAITARDARVSEDKAEVRSMPDGISPVRWFLKKSARLSLTAGAWASGSLTLPARTGPQLRVLTYHRFGTRTRDPFCVSSANFAAQMAWLAETGLAIDADTAKDFIAGRRTLDGDKVLVTIDDGYRSTLTEAAPILRDCGVPAIAFVTPSRLRSNGAAASAEGDHPEPFVSWDELDRLTEAGVTIGSHSWTHRSLGAMERSEAEEEAQRSRSALEQNLGRPVDTFAYPFGTQADFSDMTSAALAKAGYALAFTSQHGAIRPGMDSLGLPRIKI